MAEEQKKNEEQKQPEKKPEAKKPEEKKPVAEAKAEQKPSPEKATATAEEPEIELSESMKTVVETVEKLTVMELADLVKALEKKFGVSAAAPMAVAAGVGGGAAGGAAAEEEKTSFTVVLADIGSNKIQVIKEIRAITTLGLKEAKDLVEAAPKPVKEGATKEEADKIKAQLEKVGAKVELK